MVINSIGDWVVYGLGLLVVAYGSAKLLPDVVVSVTLAQYRAYRKLRIGIQQIRAELPLRIDESKYFPAVVTTESPVAATVQPLLAHTTSGTENSRALRHDPERPRPTFAGDREALATP